MLTREAIDTVTPDLWAKFCAHTEEVEEMYWKKDGLIEDVCEEIILNIGEDDDDDSSEDEAELDAESNHLCQQRQCGYVEQGCVRHLQLEHPTFTQEFLESVAPLQ